MAIVTRRSQGPQLPPRIVINLRLLPVWLQYVIALAVVAAVVGYVWITREQHPTPDWMSRYVMPWIQWGGGAALLVWIAIRAGLRWRRMRR